MALAQALLLADLFDARARRRGSTAQGGGNHPEPGDRLVELVTTLLAMPLEEAVALRCVCGGTTWWPEPDGTAERCIACGEWSPVSTPRTGLGAGAAKTR